MQLATRGISSASIPSPGSAGSSIRHRCWWALGMVPKLQINLGPEAMWPPEKADEEGAEVCGHFRFLLTSALLWARFEHSANKPQAKG